MNWLQRLLKTRQMEEQLDAELRFHFEAQVTDKVRDGMSGSEARRKTRIEFGGLEQIKQECRESRGTMWRTYVLAFACCYGLRDFLRRRFWCWRWG